MGAPDGEESQGEAEGSQEEDQIEHKRGRPDDCRGRGKRCPVDPPEDPARKQEKAQRGSEEGQPRKGRVGHGKWLFYVLPRARRRDQCAGGGGAGWGVAGLMRCRTTGLRTAATAARIG